MYPESTEGLVPLLGTYLEGEILQVYKTIVKNTFDYADVRHQLLTWFREVVARDRKQETQRSLYSHSDLKVSRVEHSQVAKSWKCPSSGRNSCQPYLS